MTVLDFISCVSDSANVKLFSHNSKQLSEYNGKNSIDKKYNNCIIDYISCANHCINIFIRK